MDADETSEFVQSAYRVTDGAVEVRLWQRGWAVTDRRAADHVPLEWFWPPTAPAGFGGATPVESGRSSGRVQATPWRVPTRLTRGPDGRWRLVYGAATAQGPAPSREYVDDDELLGDLERIECWPMTVEEARAIRAERLMVTTTAVADDAFVQAFDLTEPYLTRRGEIDTHLRHDAERRAGMTSAQQPPTPGPPGSMVARAALIDAEAWASAVRTARAGGAGWGVNGRRPPYEIAQAYAAGELTREQVIDLLIKYPYDPTPSTDGYDSLIVDEPGTHTGEEIVRAWDDGLIDEGIYEEVGRAHSGRCPASGADAGRMVEIGGTDEWWIVCPSCGMRWAGGGTVLGEHNCPGS